MEKINQCAICKYGKTLRIHVLTGDRNCKAGKHNPSGVCKDFEKENTDIVVKKASEARSVGEKLIARGFKVRMYPIYEDGIRKFVISSWKEK